MWPRVYWTHRQTPEATGAAETSELLKVDITQKLGMAEKLGWVTFHNTVFKDRLLKYFEEKNTYLGLCRLPGSVENIRQLLPKILKIGGSIKHIILWDYLMTETKLAKFLQY